MFNAKLVILTELDSAWLLSYVNKITFLFGVENPKLETPENYKASHQATPKSTKHKGILEPNR